jgi:hypothetical protein
LEVVSGGSDNVRREAAPFSYRLISARFLRDLAEIMVLINLKGLVNKFEQNRLGLQDSPPRSEAWQTHYRSDLKISSLIGAIVT